MFLTHRLSDIYLNCFGGTKVATSKGGPVCGRFYPYKVFPHANSLFSPVASSLALVMISEKKENFYFVFKFYLKFQVYSVLIRHLYSL